MAKESKIQGRALCGGREAPLGTELRPTPPPKMQGRALCGGREAPLGTESRPTPPPKKK